MTDPLISLCTTCFNRSFQLKQTFAQNAEVVRSNPHVEWVILNYGSRDDLDDFVGAQLPNVSHRIIYVRNLDPLPWHLSVAKNLAHRVAGGKMLMSLDCDNFIGPALEMIEKGLRAGCGFVHMWTGVFGDGTCGRVAIKREHFFALGGYDESFHPMGFQDLDLIQRALASGVTGIQIPSPAGIAIANTKEDAIKYCRTNGSTWSDYDLANRARSRANILAGNLIANRQPSWRELKIEPRRGLGGD